MSKTTNKTVKNAKKEGNVKMDANKTVKNAKVEEVVKMDEVAVEQVVIEEPVVEVPAGEEQAKETVAIIQDADKAVNAVEQLAEDTASAVEQMAEETVVAVEQMAEDTVEQIAEVAMPLPEVSLKDAELIVRTIKETLESPEYSDSLKVVNIMQYLQVNVDMTEVPPALAPDYELTRRIRILQSKKTAASKNYQFEEVMQLEQQIAYLNSCKKGSVASKSSATSKPEDTDHSKLTQEELRKKIRNYQSRKSTCKKAADAAKASGNEQGYQDNIALVDYWQSMVTKAQSHIQGSATRANEVENSAKALLATLKAMPSTPEIEAAITNLEMTLK